MSGEVNQIIVEYINNVTGAHQQRVEHLSQANKAVQKEYTVIRGQLDSLKADSQLMNHEIDQFIGTFAAIDQVQADVRATEENIDVIFRTIGTLAKKVAELKKNQKK